MITIPKKDSSGKNKKTLVAEASKGQRFKVTKNKLQNVLCKKQTVILRIQFMSNSNHRELTLAKTTKTAEKTADATVSRENFLFIRGNCDDIFQV